MRNADQESGIQRGIPQVPEKGKQSCHDDADGPRVARQANLKPIAEIAPDMGIGSDLLEYYGGDKIAKTKLDAVELLAGRPKAKYVVVTAITPTPLGEGKTTTTVGLGMGMHHAGKLATITIRQPSMGPTFGIKGGAAGGGYSPEFRST